MTCIISGCFHFDDLRARLSRDQVARLAAVVSIKFDRFADVVERLGPRVSLTDAARQRRSPDDESTVLLLLQNNRVSHRCFSGVWLDQWPRKAFYPVVRPATTRRRPTRAPRTIRPPAVDSARSAGPRVGSP